MEKIFLILLFVLTISGTYLSSSFAECTSCLSQPEQSSPGGDHPDETFAVDGGFFREGVTPLNSDPDAVTFQNGYYAELSSFFTNFKKGEVSTDADSSAIDLIQTTPTLIIPSGGLYGMENSVFFKATLDEYVKQGGTLIVFAQQRGYEFNILPTPDGKPVTGYGWTEDQSCFTNGTYIDTWHQMLSGQNRSTPTMNVDGYFTGYPDNSTILLRRSKNDQPAMIMYEHGAGRVIATTMYSDWAFAHGQASPEETALVRDMISWAKKPAELPEAGRYSSVTVTAEVNNLTGSDAASVKLYVYDPDRKNILYETTSGVGVASGQSASIPVTYTTGSTSPLGIYHVDYELYDAAGEILQPRAESDSGRFAVSNPPEELTTTLDLSFSVNSDSENYAYGSDALFTVTMYNNTDIERIITAKYFFPHHYLEFREAQYGGAFEKHDFKITKTMTIPPNSSVSFLHTLENARAVRDRLWAYFYDEEGNNVGNASRAFYVFDPSMDVDVKADKPLYLKGDAVNLDLTFINRQDIAFNSEVNVLVKDPSNSLVYSSTLNESLGRNGSVTRNLSFNLPDNAGGGQYSVYVEAKDSEGNKIGGDSASFEIPISNILLEPTLPGFLSAGANTISFNITNNGIIDVSSGKLDVAFNGPDGNQLASGIFDFPLNMGESITRSIDFMLPAPQFGTYKLGLSQSDETREGKPVLIEVNNDTNISLKFDKSSYRVRETANIALNLINTGSLTQNDLLVTVDIPDATYSYSETIDLAAGQEIGLNKSLILPEIVTAGLHKALVTLTLPSGSSINKEFSFSIPESSLSLEFDKRDYTAGEIILFKVSNTGGSDTDAEYRFRLYDARSVLVAEKADVLAVQAGSYSQTELLVPQGVADGAYNLVIDYLDQKTTRSDMIYHSMNITGVKAGLGVLTDKEINLETEDITGASAITNSGTPNEAGNLHLKVITAPGASRQKTWTSQYDFQQNTIRDGVDTYGVNDWLIPNDDFDDGIVDGDRWTKGTEGNGNLPVEENSLLKLTTSGGGKGRSYVQSKYQLQGDFDVQVDFNLVAFLEESSYAMLSASYDNGSSFRIGRADSSYQSYREVPAEVEFSTSSQTTGKIRLTREGATAKSWYWNGSEWLNLSTWDVSEAPVKITLEASNGAETDQLDVRFDNLRVKSGRIMTVNETVDSVRLLPFNDNFDDGIVNEDRWSLRGQVIPYESSGVLNFSYDSTTFTERSYIAFNAYVRPTWPMKGDFEATVEYRNFQVNPENKTFAYFSLMGIAYQNNKPSYFYTVRDSKDTGQNVYGCSGISGYYRCGNQTPYESGSGMFRVKRVGSTAYTYFWDGSNWQMMHSRVGIYTTPATIRLYIQSQYAKPSIDVGADNYYTDAGKYLKKGTLSLKYDSEKEGNIWEDITWSSTIPSGTSIKLRTRTAATEELLSYAAWSSYMTVSDSEITSSDGRWIEVEVLMETANSEITPILHDVTVASKQEASEVLWETDVPVNMVEDALSEMNHEIGTLGVTGKLYLQGTLTSGTGQSLAESEYPFYIIKGNTALLFNTDKKIYKTGETVTITGEVKNLASLESSGLDFQLKADGENVLTASYEIPAAGSQPFSATYTTTGAGEVVVSGIVSKSGIKLIDTTDTFEVAMPDVSLTVLAPDVTGSKPFDLNVELTNKGRVDAELLLVLSDDNGNSIDEIPVSIAAGESRMLSYTQSISQNNSYRASISGDDMETTSKLVVYGEALVIELGPVGDTFGTSGIAAEGLVNIPVKVTNAGLMAEEVSVNYQLSDVNGNQIAEEMRTYYLPLAANTTDTLSYELPVGNYRLSAISNTPSATAETFFKVAKAVDAAMTVTIGDQSDILISVTAEVTNDGLQTFNGDVRVSMINTQGLKLWSGSKKVEELKSGESSTNILNINSVAIEPGTYEVTTVLYDATGQEMSSESGTITIADANFEITSFPGYETLIPGQPANLDFVITNSGGKEGEVGLSLNLIDVIDHTKTKWLKPGEEKEISFAFVMPDDLEEKDYFADYELKDGAGQTIEKGQIKFHLSGIDIAVEAALDKEYYSDGDSAVLNLDVSNLNTEMSDINLFARVNYAGHEEQRPFTLNGSEALTFEIPLNEITGEKLFYGIYHNEGRSIHLNTLYIYEAGEVITIITDKQVYNPGESVAVSLTGTAAGEMTLTGPGDYSETFDFGGSASKSIVLPQIMKAGTYQIKYQLAAQDGESYSGTHHIDVNGIQVRVTEALLDKAKYNASDTLKLDLKIESNIDISASLKTWVIDPTGNDFLVGGDSLSLSSTEPVSLTHSAPLDTEFLGIHRLVYGIYKDDLLLASGSEAFDVGDALLMGLSTDKYDYAEFGDAVQVKLSMYGTVSANIELYLDGELIKTEQVALNGHENSVTVLDESTVSPGNHSLKAVLLSGGLKSEKETSFVYGSSLPDLIVQVDTVKGEQLTLERVTAIVTNQGKTASRASNVVLFDGDPADGQIIASVNVPVLAPSDSATVSYDLNLLGKAGNHQIFAVADAENSVLEFIEGNNSSVAYLDIPDLDMKLTTTAESYEANQSAGIVKKIINFTADTSYSDAEIEMIIRGPGGIEVDVTTESIATLTPGTLSLVDAWNTGSNMPGSYEVEANISASAIVEGEVAGEEVLASASTVFDVLPTLSVQGEMLLSSSEIIQGFPLGIDYSMTNNGNVDISSAELKAGLTDKASNEETAFAVAPLEFLAVQETATGQFEVESVDVEPGEYMLGLTLLAEGKLIDIAEKDLTVKPPLKVTKELSSLPRVLVWIGEKADKKKQSGSFESTPDEIIALTALDNIGAYYRIVRNQDEFTEGMRSDLFNTFALLDTNGPTTGGLTLELVERVRGGDTLILTSKSNIDEIKVRGVTGTKFNGYMKDATRSATTGLPLYDQPSGLMVSGKVQKLELNSNNVDAAALISDKGKDYPLVTINEFGSGRGVLLAFDIGASATVSGSPVSYSTLLEKVIGYASPKEVDITANTVLPVEIRIESLGSVFDIKVVENTGGLLILDANSNGVIDINNRSIAWSAHLNENESVRFIYMAELPEFSSSVEAVSDVYYLQNAEERLYNSYALVIDVVEGVIDLQTRILNTLNQLNVPQEETDIKNEILSDFERVMTSGSTTRKDIDKDIQRLVRVASQLDKLSVDISDVRAAIDDLLVVLERKWEASR